MTLRFVHLLTLIGAITVFTCDENVAVASDKSGRVSGNGACGIAELFDERIVASNVAIVRQHAARLPDAERFDQLLQWVLPSLTHFTIRMNGEFTQTNPAPLNSSGLEGDDLQGGVQVSPVFDLLDLAKKSNRLHEFLKVVEAIPESASNQLSEMWPETLVVSIAQSCILAAMSLSMTCSPMCLCSEVREKDHKDSSHGTIRLRHWQGESDCVTGRAKWSRRDAPTGPECDCAPGPVPVGFRQSIEIDHTWTWISAGSLGTAGQSHRQDFGARRRLFVFSQPIARQLRNGV